MKKIIHLIIFLFLINIVYAQRFNDYSALDITTKIKSDIELNPTSSDYDISEVSLNLSFFPRTNDYQSSSYSFNLDPKIEPLVENNYIIANWNNPIEHKLKFELNSKVSTKINFVKIKDKVKFPIEDDSYKEYTLGSDTVTSDDPLIISKANELAEGEDDLYILVNKIGAWTKSNINYSLETLTAEVSQNATWVLQNKKGVCDELTSLFVAMLRSLKIPARFVTGQAYTDAINGFGNHAWAEVYFSGYGWIAFDPTYGQLGYVDSTHIDMKNSLDVSESSAIYLWEGRNIDLEFSKLEINSSITKKYDIYQEDVKLNLDLLENDVGPGSYVPVKIEAENLNDYYLTLSVYLTRVPIEVKNYAQDIVLKPKEKKNVFFIVEVPKNLDSEFTYTSQVQFKDNFNHIAESTLRFDNSNNIYTLENAKNKVDELKEEDKKVYSRNVDVKCDKNKEFYYGYEDANVRCEISNIGNVILNDLDLCYLNKCNKINLNIAEKKYIDINLSVKDVKNELLVELENNEVSKKGFVNLNILNLPNLTIRGLIYPGEVSYDQEFNFDFILDVNSEAKAIEIKLNNKRLNFKNLDQSKKFEIKSYGKDFYKKINILEINYKDKNDKKYNINQDLNINVKNVPFYIKYSWMILIIIFLMISMIFRKKLHH